MSDSESDSDYGTDWNDSIHEIYDTSIIHHPSEVFDRWGSIPADTKKEAVQRMKICTFWLPILLQYEESSHTVSWAVQMGLLDAIDREHISLKQLHKIEILEAVLRALETGSLKWDQTKHIFWISNMFNVRSPEVLQDALLWLERTGEPAIRHRVLELGHVHICFTALQFIFTEFAKYIHAMGSKLEKTMRSLMAQPPDHYIEKSEEMKQKGNENFQKNQYEDAVDYYTKAISFYPDNHIIYGNRALCYIRCKKYLKAVVDGKRAILIKPLWAKGHYRYCDALFALGEVTKAIEANGSAQTLCKDDQQGVKDLKQQHLRFITEIAERKAGKPKSKNKRPSSTNRAVGAELRQQSKTGPVTSVAQQSKISEVKLGMQPGKNAQIKGTTKDCKPSKSEVSSKNEKVESSTAAKKKSKNRNDQSEVKNQTVADSKASVCKRLRTVVQDAHIALADLRSRNAEQAFSQSLAILETNTPKDIGLTKMDVIMLLYGRASALTEIGQPEELAEAQKLLEKIKSFEERTFQCLVYYAIGRVYLKENRFALALEQFSNSLQMVKNQITPGKLTWPLTKEIVKETEPEYFKEILDRAIELCKFPPAPDGICRLEKCHGFLKAEIYLTDPDFKGFIQIHCCQSCTIEYHITCWKTLKSIKSFEKNEKDFLQEPCLTPDCVGQICSIKITGPTGLLKCKFEVAIPKPQIPKKPKMNQKCSSSKKLKLKAELRLKRKQENQFQDKQTINGETLQQIDGSASQSQQKAWLLYRDRVLLQISQKMELLREETGLHVSDLISSLKPWLKVDSARGNQLAERMLNWQQEQLDTFGQAVELLLERKNRVWARVLIQLLSSCLNINPKLGSWACHLNESGLNAAKSFIERHIGHLEQLDLALLLSFGPLQEMVMDKLGARPELFSSIGLNLTDYLKQAGPHDMRLFIWTLEEHRDEYLTCHNILDDYFDMMDAHCSVLKKSDENQNNSPMKAKSRGRKKKRKEPMGFYVFPGSRVVTPRDDQDFFEDDSLSFLHPADSFSVPSHLREQIADFENEYNSTRRGSYYKHFLDNNPDPTKETLYDYFAQILEEHGPLVAEDPLLVGELENFPPVAQLTIQQAGGFESFLLESLRFIKMGKCIGLAKHAVSLQQAGHGASLDDLDLIVDPNINNIPPNLQQPVFTSQNVSCGQANVYVTLPSPYIFGFPSESENTSSAGIFTGNQPLPQWSNGDIQQHTHYFSYEDVRELDPHVTESDVLEMDPSTGGVVSLTTEEGILKKHAAAQTCPETMSSVAVNTELHERFETHQGDINRKEKHMKQLEQQIKEMANGCNKVNPKHKEDIAFLEEDIQNITANIQVTNKELTLFQQKLEEELKMDQKEKKANQEVLKSLKLEIEGLVEENESLARSIREKNTNYEAKLNDFLELSNQSAAEKLSLEDEIKRSKALCTSATRRSLTAQVSVVESSRDQSLYSLYRELADAKAFLMKLDDAIHRYPNQDLDISRSTWKSNLQEVEKKISTAEKLYQEQIGQVKNGRRVTEWFLSNINNQSEPPGQLAAASPATEVQAALIQTQHKPPPGTQEPPHTTFDKAMERLATIFPDYTRSDLMRFVQQLRSSSGGSFSSLALQDLVGGVTQLILDHQEKLNHARSNIVGRGSPAQCYSLPVVTPAPVWQPVGPLRTVQPKALNMEDPCIICHEDMSPDDICVLECRHSFHDECIRSWLKEKSTCPTCRDHALMPDDFPSLPGRRHKAP